jgi:hypothetical protein
VNMARRIKILQLHPAYKEKRHDVSDLGEQIVKSLLAPWDGWRN